ncbi:MAG: 50S ribosomal protein L20 [Myxococcota bacterium]
MSRVKRGTKARARRNRVLKAARGYYGGRSKQFRTAKNTLDRALAYAYRGRKEKKRQFRQLWVVRIGAATREYGMNYTNFIHGLKLAGIELDRKMLSEIAISDPPAFKELVNAARNALNG